MDVPVACEFSNWLFEAQESFYFKNALKSSERLELVVCMYRLLKLVPYAVVSK